jgi:hypothetical protein
MAGYKCNVTESTSSKKIAPAQIARYCEDDTTNCVKGAKQMIAFNRKKNDSRQNFASANHKTEKTGNNVQVPDGKTPMYNKAWGWKTGM